MSEIYTPSEDSFFFSDFLKEELNKKLISKKIKFLDMGCGSCIIAKTAEEKGILDITCVDINNEAVKLALKKGLRP